MEDCQEELHNSLLIIWPEQDNFFMFDLGLFYEKRSDTRKCDKVDTAVCSPHDLGESATAVL